MPPGRPRSSEQGRPSPERFDEAVLAWPSRPTRTDERGATSRNSPSRFGVRVRGTAITFACDGGRGTTKGIPERDEVVALNRQWQAALLISRVRTDCRENLEARRIATSFHHRQRGRDGARADRNRTGRAREMTNECQRLRSFGEGSSQLSRENEVERAGSRTPASSLRSAGCTCAEVTFVEAGQR